MRSDFSYETSADAEDGADDRENISAENTEETGAENEEQTPADSVHSDFSYETSADAEDGADDRGDISAENTGEIGAENEEQTLTANEYSDSIDTVLETKQYHHWESEADRARNREEIDRYDQKKRAVDKASLETQSAVLKEHNARFTYENLTRIESELGSNKTEIYSEKTFAEDKDPSFGAYKILGLRDIPDGKICVRDNDDFDALRHVSTHETMHDLSFQAANHEVNSRYEDNGRAVTESETTLSSGLHRVEKREVTVNGEMLESEIRQYNRYLNEGFTELYTIEEMQRRGERPSFDSYTDEVGWAMTLREKVGDDAIADAYFGGRLDDLSNRVNSMSGVPDAWKQLNRRIDAYHYTKDLKHREAVNSILDSLRDAAEEKGDKK